jgi:hypothetical protein
VGVVRTLVTRSLACLLWCCALVACARAPTPAPSDAVVPTAATRPAQAVQLLTRHLRDNDLAAFARDAVPPALHAQLQVAWQQGRTRWPLDELPFDDRLPVLLSTLAAAEAPTRLQRGFDQQFAGAGPQIRGAAASLGLFGAQYIQRQGDYSDDERQHYAQLIQAASRWGTRAPLADRERARRAILGLTAAARRSGLASAADFPRLGMDDSLQRMGAFAAAFKQALAPYGLDLDASLDAMRVTLQQQTGDSARVRMQYPFAGQDIDTVVAVERVDGHWYLSDYLHHATTAIEGPSPAGATAAR